MVLLQKAWVAYIQVVASYSQKKKKKKSCRPVKKNLSIHYSRPYIESIFLSFVASGSRLSKLMELDILQPQFPNCVQ